MSRGVVAILQSDLWRLALMCMALLLAAWAPDLLRACAVAEHRSMLAGTFDLRMALLSA